MIGLAELHARGLGVAKDPAAAVAWHRQAALRGAAPAMVALGFAYSLGEGTAADAAEAYAWFTIAAAYGAPSAQEALRALTQQMKPEAIEAGKRRIADRARELRAPGGGG